MEQITDYLSRYKNYNFAVGYTTPEHIDSLQSFEIRDSDVLLVTYPKSGTIWTQQIIISIYELDGGLYEYANNLEHMPWLEYREGRGDYALRPSPRLFTSPHPGSHASGTKGQEGKGQNYLRDAESKGQHCLLLPLQ
ncbi:hypothetical protein EPR50_G00161640 [Perca flavescens]|uniref:Sulfotransferase n=1 Tax=Perca flavescens TaxID=8167 RepID=A0A484CGU1_PERFV|nr:hypothetical protein EPR50_G00161640 [Perca flavescens]